MHRALSYFQQNTYIRANYSLPCTTTKTSGYAEPPGTWTAVILILKWRLRPYLRQEHKDAVQALEEGGVGRRVYIQELQAEPQEDRRL